jgi:hypothetical protein
VAAARAAGWGAGKRGGAERSRAGAAKRKGSGVRARERRSRARGEAAARPRGRVTGAWARDKGGVPRGEARVQLGSRPEACSGLGWGAPHHVPRLGGALPGRGGLRFVERRDGGTGGSGRSGPFLFFWFLPQHPPWITIPRLPGLARGCGWAVLPDRERGAGWLPPVRCNSVPPGATRTVIRVSLATVRL